MPNLNQLVEQAMQAPPAGAVNVAQPLNDVQLVALIAAHYGYDAGPAQAVKRAFDVVTESIVIMQGDALRKAVMARMQAKQGNGILHGH